MTDLLAEALARADNAPHYDLGWQIDPDSADTIVDAARNWHTLTNPTDELIAMLGAAVREVSVINNYGVGEQIARAVVYRLVDALTDTAEPDD